VEVIQIGSWIADEKRVFVQPLVTVSPAVQTVLTSMRIETAFGCHNRQWMRAVEAAFASGIPSVAVEPTASRQYPAVDVLASVFSFARAIAPRPVEVEIVPWSSEWKSLWIGRATLRGYQLDVR
jgi:hypothetical protein